MQVMQVTVNGAPREVSDGLTVKEFLATLGLASGPVAVEINRAIVPRAQHATQRLQAGDTLEVVHFVGGG
jgi:thiamine biosynthesis protein ThiS